MTISGYSNAIVDVMLGWLKGLANWVLRLFNLAGSVTTSPLLWLSQNWLKLLIFFLALGVAMDVLIWLIRWRPYWVWFRKERVIVNDDRFFASADMDKAPERESDLVDNWDEHDYVVASTVVRRRNRQKPKASTVAEVKRPRGTKPVPAQGGRRSAATKVKRHPQRDDDAQWRREPAEKNVPKRDQPGPESASDSIFAVKLNKPDVSDFYEDEVFNVANLPASDEFESGEAREGAGKKARE